MSYGVRFVLVGLGTPDGPATDEDVEAAAARIMARTGFVAKAASENLSGMIVAKRGIPA